MIPSVDNGRNDVMIGGVADEETRHGKVSFIDYYRARMRFLVKAGNPFNVDPANACGQKAAIATGSTYQTEIIQAVSDKCVAEGKAKIEIVEVADPGTVYLTILNKRVGFTVQDPAKAEYVASQDKRLALLDGFIPGDEGTASGWLFNKNNDELRTAFLTAIDELIADGTWQKILAKGGLTEVAELPPIASPPLSTSK